ncbi:hypothetical protein E2C01_074812 [Portunus trituberculatus]|uniref:Uncharacterized protein n=1 Tax=Portunus trituberculatus TaxID=210409 RepID=A0A5B7IH82_PORTR|nr:hypothetical protein [Portunus trituberculatus]
MQQKRDPQNSQNRRLLREAFLEGNPPSHSDLKMTCRGPGQPPHENLNRQRKPPTRTTMGGSAGCRGGGTSSPCGQVVLKKRSHMIRKFVHGRAETPSQSIPAWTPNHPAQDGPLLGDPSSGWLRWSTRARKHPNHNKAVPIWGGGVHGGS